MHKKKKSFVLHYDALDILDDLDNEEVAQIFRKIKAYHKKEPFELPRHLELLFKGFEKQFIRDNSKYEERCKKAKENIEKRWNKSNTKDTSVYEGIPTHTKHTDNDNVNVNDNDNVNDKSVATLTPTQEIAIFVSDYLLYKILEVQPTFKQPNLTAWVKDIDLAIRIDKRTKDQLIDCINWIYSNDGNFWVSNILSGKKLRAKFDTMESQMMSKSRSNEIDFSFMDELDALDAQKEAQNEY